MNYEEEDAVAYHNTLDWGTSSIPYSLNYFINGKYLVGWDDKVAFISLEGLRRAMRAKLEQRSKWVYAEVGDTFAVVAYKDFREVTRLEKTIEVAKRP